MEQQYQALQAAVLAGAAILITAIAVFLKEYLALRTKFKSLEAKKQEVDIDDTAMRSKISAEAQALIQKLYVDQNERLKTLEDDLRHQRDLIDQGASERSRLEAQKDELEKQLNKAQEQQIENIKKIAAMEQMAQELQLLKDENTRLTGQVAELRKQVEEAEIRAENRHAEMSRITGENFELNTKLRSANAELENARRLLRECNDLVAQHESRYPELRQLPILPVSGITPVESKGESNEPQP